MGVKQESDRSSPPHPVVVAAAIVRHGRVLAARRIRPAEPAGAWEFPGGKVEPGESERDALIRECREELGIRVRVLERVGPEVGLPGGATLRCYHAVLEDDSAEPEPGADHDALRWLGAEELDDVAWLPADRPLAEALRDLLDRENPLPGGNVGGAVRVGATVRRPAGPWTPTVHALLAHLRRVGVPGVPQVLGIDEQGREILSYVEGTTVGEGRPDRAHSDTLLVQTMRWLAGYHRAVAGFRPASPRWRLDPRPVEPGEIICHNDIAPYNLVVSGLDTESGPRLVGVVDWDVAGPGRPIDDVAFAAWNLLPLSGGASTSAGTPSDQEVARKLRLLVESYGRYEPDEVLRRVPVRLRAGFARIRAGAERGDAGMRHLLGTGRITVAEHALAAFEARLPALLAAVH